MEYFFYIFISLVSFGCQTLPHKTHTVVDYRIKFDTFVGEGPNLKSDFTVKIVSFEGMTAFVMASPRTSTTSVLDTKTGKIEDDSPIYDTVFYYYITRKDLDYALKFDSLASTKGSRVEMDYLNELLNVGKLNRKTISMDGDSLIYSEKKKGKLIAEHFIQDKYQYPDSIFRYYDSQLKGLNFSISPILDERSKSKLVKVKMVFNKKIENGVAKNREEFSLELKEGKYDDINKIKKLFELFNLQIAKGKILKSRTRD